MGRLVAQSAAWFLQLTGLKMAHIPFRGAAPALTAVVGGQVEVLFDNLFPSLPQINDGKLRPLAVTSTRRVALAPDVPTMMESAPELTKFQVTSWFGIFLPAGTPQPVVDALDAEIKRMLALDGFQKRMSDIGPTPTPQAPAEFAAFVQAETEKFGSIIKKEGLQVDVAQ